MISDVVLIEYIKVIPDIRGGIIVEIGERTIDLSVAAKMAKLNKLLTDQL
jgi:F-type H+-transporting ATPase subunit O